MAFPVILFSQMWRAQIEQSLKVMAFWAQFLPHETAREAAAEAESLRATPRKRQRG